MQKIQIMTAKNILVVDDDVFQVTFINHILTKSGYKADFAYDGETALSNILKNSYDLILLDISLPGIDGFEVCRRLKKNAKTRNIPVILISSLEDSENIYEKGFEVGAMDYLKKPVTPAELIFKIKNFLKFARTELKLKQNEILFKSIVNDQTEFVVRYRPDGTLTFVNAAFSFYFNKTASELIGSNFFDQLNLGKDNEIRTKVFRTDMPNQTDIIEIPQPDGTKVWHQWVHKSLIDKINNERFIQSIGRDITISEVAIKALAESEERFRTIFWNSPDIIVIFRLKDFVIVDVNDKFISETGYNREDMLNKHYSVLRFLKDPSGPANILQLLNEEEVISNLEVELKTRYNLGITTLVSWSRISLYGSDHVIATVRNIEEIKRIQESLQKSETKFRLLADYNYNWEFWLDPAGKFIYVSPSCERVSGYKSSDFENNPELMFDLIHPDYSELCHDHFKSGHCDTSPEIALEFLIIDRNGNEKWISHNSYAVFNDSGKFLGRRGNNLDITQKKIAENELNKLLTAIEQSSSAVVITDIRGIIEYANPFFEKLTGYGAKEAIGKSMNILKSGKTHPEVYEDLWTAIKSGKIWQGEFINRRKNGELYIEHAVITPVKDSTSKIVNYIAIKQDITKQKEQDRKTLQTIISTQEKERGRLAQDLHDDLGPLLSTAKLYIKSIETAKNLKNKQIALSRSLQAIDEAILSIKEIAYNLSPHVLRNFGLIPGINSLINKINETRTLRIEFKPELNERLDENIESSIFRIISELLNNTIKHAGANKVEITIKKYKNQLFAIYTDNGKGFLLDEALSKNLSRGLSNIINRVKSHGGEIIFDTKNGGFRILITIPLDNINEPVGI